MNFFWMLLFGSLALFNVFTFFLMYWDKQQARKGRARIPEARFFNYAAFGASIGILLAMPLLRHKNRKWSFRGRIYAIGAGQLLLVVLVWRWFGSYLF